MGVMEGSARTTRTGANFLAPKTDEPEKRPRRTLNVILNGDRHTVRRHAALAQSAVCRVSWFAYFILLPGVSLHFEPNMPL
ncbi:hypothetical protein EVAR_94649_1 [Eumeta japonica]|uniref:Uncharacterized protein n=1 Tax=Eumeta variegata TaxID=151549 RepID=A0A4C1UU39_EUMVA|nr:hypothetical protein EVAR_94649_1 [Eumeta japonica]